MKFSRILLYISMFIIIFSLRLWGMELVSISSHTSSSQEEYFTLPHEISSQEEQPSTNSTLKAITTILEKNLGTSKYTISSDGSKKHLCSLSNLTSDLISGPSNKLLRKNIKNLLYKPLTDPYYGFRLKQNDFKILRILQKAISQDMPIYSSLSYKMFKNEDLKKLNILIKYILPGDIYEKETNSVYEYKDNQEIPQLFIRRSIDEIHNILSNKFGTDDYGVFSLFALRKTKSINLIQERHHSLRMTLSKVNMMALFDLTDFNNIRDLKTALFDSDGQIGDFDTHTQQKLEILFNDVIKAFEVHQETTFTTQKKLEKIMAVSDIPWLQLCADSQGIIKNIKGIKDELSNIRRHLKSMFGCKNYLHHLPFYKENKMWRKRHTEMLKKLKKENNDPDYLIDLFAELSQMKMALNCLSNAWDRRVFKMKNRGGKNIIWSQIPEAVKNLSEHINEIKSNILLMLDNGKTARKSLKTLQNKKNENDKKIKDLNDKDAIWILSLDGGGIRGKIAAEILRDISQKLNNDTIFKKFDFFAGTSVGGLIGLSLTAPDENKRPAYTTEYVADLLEKEKAAVIFPKVGSRTKQHSQATSYAYDPTPLENLLVANFGYTKLSDAMKPTMVMTHEHGPLGSHALKSGDPLAEEIYTWGAARGTTAASTYFPPTTLNYNGKLAEVVDAGISANNPAHEALNEVLELRKRKGAVPLQKINVLSIGTGDVRIQKPYGKTNPGIMSVIDALDAGINKHVTEAHGRVNDKLTIESMKNVEVTHYRLNPILDSAIELDDSSEQNMAKLRKAIYDQIFSSPFYADLIRHLTEGENENTKNHCVQISGKFDGENQDKKIDLTGIRRNFPDNQDLIIVGENQNEMNDLTENRQNLLDNKKITVSLEGEAI